MISPRETEVIMLLANGLTHKEIATELYLSRHTINTHVKNIQHKLSAKNVAHMIWLAIKRDIITLEHTLV